MITIDCEFKWNISTIAVAIYTYFLHTRVDIESEDITFVYYSQGKFERYYLNVQDDMTFFQMVGSVIVKEFDLSELNQSSISILFSEEEVEIDYSKFVFFMKRKSREITVDFIGDFSFYQTSNFEKFFNRVLKYTIEHGDCKLKDYSILKKAEAISLQHLYDGTQCNYNENRLILDDFYNSLVSTPLKECIIFRNERFTYRAIEEQANQIANMLNRAGVRLHDGVVIYMERSERIMSSILAIMKCGGFYLPVDVSTPIERLANITEDALPQAILTDSQRYDELCKVFSSKSIKIYDVFHIDEYNTTLEFKRAVMSKEAPCYMIYTSGTSGKPKGVLIRNRNIANFISNNILAIQAQDIDEPCLIAANKVGFDAFVGDMLLSIAAGFKIVMASAEELDNPHLFVQAIKRSFVNIIQTTPTRINLSIMNYYPEVIKRFRVIACGGEPLGSELISKIYHYAPNVTLINLYGPTETTVWSTAANLSLNQKGIGLPSQNTQCYILNRYGKFMPRYETGILYIGGDGLGSYCFDPVAQSEKFLYVESVGETIYNSGDTAYIDESNYIIYGARADSQVKINGVRIELSEIESVAKKSGLIKDCAVAVKEIPNIGHRLVLYYTSDVSVDIKMLRDSLKELPDTYKPNYYVYLKSIPLTSSSKIDRKSLPLPKIEMDEIVAPRTKCERDLLRICQNQRPALSFGVTHILRDIGFDSLDMVTIIAEMEELGYSFSSSVYKKFQSTETIESIANKIESQDSWESGEYSIFPQKAFNKLMDVSDYQTVLLTGASGFLGVHVLAELLQATNCKIICLTHKASVEERYASYQFATPFNSKRVVVLHGDLYLENFGLSDDDYEILEEVDAIINCAALVKYFGEAEAFHKANVMSVKNLAEFAIKRNIIFNHMSTLSVLGGDNSSPIDEHSFYINQDEVFNNQYVESKFLGEFEILKRVGDGLKHRIIRVGRLAWRKKDYVFQVNRDENEFYSILKLFWCIRKVPKELLDVDIEVSPIDYCAKAIVLLTKQKYINGIFHVMNENSIKLQTIIDSFNSIGRNIETVSMDEFINTFKGWTENDSLKKMVQICCIRNDHLLIENNTAVQNTMTAKILNGVRFKWPKIDGKYFVEFITQCKWFEE